MAAPATLRPRDFRPLDGQAVSEEQAAQAFAGLAVAMFAGSTFGPRHLPAFINDLDRLGRNAPANATGRILRRAADLLMATEAN
jgi:hypothetical protein